MPNFRISYELICQLDPHRGLQPLGPARGGSAPNPGPTSADAAVSRAPPLALASSVRFLISVVYTIQLKHSFGVIKMFEKAFFKLIKNCNYLDGMRRAGDAA